MKERIPTQHSDSRRRLIVPIGLMGVTSNGCGECYYLSTDTASCKLYKKDLNWHPKTLAFYRCDTCKFWEQGR